MISGISASAKMDLAAELSEANMPPPMLMPTPAGEAEQQIRLRVNFNALAVFAPSVRTDANGHAEVQVQLPDNLTRYRVMAVAVAGGKQFGMGESAITRTPNRPAARISLATARSDARSVTRR